MQKMDKTGIGISVAEKVKRRFPSRTQGDLFHAKQQRGYGFKFKKAL